MNIGKEKERVPGDIVLKHVRHIADPAIPKRHPLLPFAKMRRAPARIDTLLKQGNPRLGPQLPTQQQRRVCTHRKHRSRQHLRPVVAVGKLLRLHLVMALKTRVARLKQDVVMLQDELVHARDIELEIPAPQLRNRIRQRDVPRFRGDVLHLDRPDIDRRQNPRKHNLFAALLGHRLRLPQQRNQLRLHLRKTIAPQLPRIQVDLQIVPRQLRRKMRVVDSFQHIQRVLRRLVIPVDEAKLLLRPNSRDP